MKQFPLFKLCIIYSFFAGLAAYRVIGRKMLQAFVNMIKFPQELSLFNLVNEVRYQQELSKSIQNSEQGFCAAETEMIHFAFKCFSVMHQTAAMEENDRRREADRQVFYKCLTWSEVLPTILLFLISFYFPYSVHLSFGKASFSRTGIGSPWFLCYKEYRTCLMLKVREALYKCHTLSAVLTSLLEYFSEV